MLGGEDTISIDGGEVSGYLQYDVADIVTLTSGALGGVRGTDNADTIIIDGDATAQGGTLKIAATGFTLGFVDLLGGADEITLSSGTWDSYNGGERGIGTSGIWGGADADTLILESGATITNAVTGEDGRRDVFDLSGTVGGYVDARGGNDSITLSGGTWVSYNGGERGVGTSGIWGGAGVDTFILNGATISGNILGDGEAETFTLLSGNVGTDTYVDAGAGADTITLGFETWDSYDGGARGINTDAKKIWGGAGADTFVLNGATISGDIIGENTAADTGKDIFTLTAGTVMGNVDGRAGADEITINGATVAGYLLYGEGDIVTLTSGDLREVRGTSEDDVISLGIGDDFTLGFVDLLGGADILTLTSGTWASYDGRVKTGTPTGGAIFAGAGADTLILDGATISGNIIGDSEADTFTLTSGSVGAGTYINGGRGRGYNHTQIRRMGWL